jgi:hypothetical protein
MSTHPLDRAPRDAISDPEIYPCGPRRGGCGQCGKARSGFPRGCGKAPRGRLSKRVVGRCGKARSGFPCARHGRGVEGESRRGGSLAQSFEGPDGGNLTPMGKGTGPEHRLFPAACTWAGPARGCLVETLGAVSNRVRAKRRKACAPWGEAPDSVEPRYPLVGRVYWRRCRHEAPRPYPGRSPGLRGGKPRAVVIEATR